jgi:transcriptional regulator GlxA family with amidase domain
LQSRALDHRAAALLLDLLEAAEGLSGARADPAGAGLAIEAERLIQGEYAQLRTVSDIADRLSVSASHLRHVFKQHHAIGVKRRLIQVRLDHACELLATSTLPIKAISAMCGFESDRYFSASFRAQMGCVPGEYRRNWIPI